MASVLTLSSPHPLPKGRTQCIFRERFPALPDVNILRDSLFQETSLPRGRSLSQELVALDRLRFQHLHRVIYAHRPGVGGVSQKQRQ